MQAVRSMPRANQDTNGATEAWHLTLKKMIMRIRGDIGARRVDRLVFMLFNQMLPFFYHAIKRKIEGKVINYRKEEIVLSSVHLAKHELKDEQVIFHFSIEFC